MEFTLDFQPRQIVCLEHADTCLYAEVVQVIYSRRLCWVRPLLLVAIPSNSVWDDSIQVTDLRSSPDLLWPATLFRLAFDTELIPLLKSLSNETQLLSYPSAQQEMARFIHQVWQAKKSSF